MQPAQASFEINLIINQISLLDQQRSDHIGLPPLNRKLELARATSHCNLSPETEVERACETRHTSAIRNLKPMRPRQIRAAAQETEQLPPPLFFFFFDGGGARTGAGIDTGVSTCARAALAMPRLSSSCLRRRSRQAACRRAPAWIVVAAAPLRPFSSRARATLRRAAQPRLTRWINTTAACRRESIRSWSSRREHTSRRESARRHAHCI